MRGRGRSLVWDVDLGMPLKILGGWVKECCGKKALDVLRR